MNKRNKSKVPTKPFAHNSNIVVRYELEHGKDLIQPGDKILFRNTAGKFTFIKVVDNLQLGITWIDCFQDKTQTYRSFYVQKLKSKVKPKRPRGKSV
jgi:hypothetical protein